MAAKNHFIPVGDSPKITLINLHAKVIVVIGKDNLVTVKLGGDVYDLMGIHVACNLRGIQIKGTSTSEQILLPTNELPTIEVNVPLGTELYVYNVCELKVVLTKQEEL